MSQLPAAHLQDCWNQIGVWGDATCPRLAEAAHCRNCSVYTSAAARMLHGQPPEDYLREWTERLAQPLPAPQAAKTQAVMIFRLGAEWLGLPAATFQEVAEPRPIHALPHRRGQLLKGLVNIRGELLICVALDKLLGVVTAAQAPAGDAHSSQGHISYERLVVVATEEGRLVFPVSEVHGIERHAPEQLQEVPVTLALSSARYTHGILNWRDRSVGCLDDGLLFYTLNRSLG